VGSRTLDQWALDGKSDPSWEQRPSSDGDTVIELTSLPDFQEPMALLEWAFLDGMLALHQGGGTLALIHTFCNSSLASSPIAWAESEPSILRNSSSTPYFATAQTTRPFPPTWSRDRRYLLFSTSYAAIALDLFSLPGWTNGKCAAKCAPLLMCAPDAGQIAATPIPLAGHQFGFLLRQNREEYRWYTLDLDQQSIEPWEGSAVQAVPLPIQGSPCQALMSQNALAFSTPLGHWFWRQRDAVDSKVERLIRTREITESEELRVDVQFTDPLSFSRRSQLIVEDNGYLAWFYQRADDTAECYRVSLDSPSRPHKPNECGNVAPLGQWLGPDDVPELLFRHQDQFYRFPSERYDKQARQLIKSIHTNAGQVIGQQFREPLLIEVSADSTARRQRIDLTAMRYGSGAIDQGSFDNLELIADPIVWSRWLLTCERVESAYRVLRRELPSATRPITTSRRASVPTNRPISIKD
jgi:hypothetical protein